MIILILIAVAFSLWRIARRTRFFLHLIQLEGYDTHAFLHWLQNHVHDAVIRRSHVFGAGILIGLLLNSDRYGPVFLGSISILWAVSFASSRRYRRTRQKKPLIYTPRLLRIIALSTIVMAAPFLVVLRPVQSAGDLAVLFLSLYGADLLAPFIIVLSSTLLRPVEHSIRNGFKRKARTILAGRQDLAIIAITGSYGKTSVKFATDRVLGYRFPVLATPGSYNTPMGICKVVNNHLDSAHRMLILEMGIRHPGDIAELCDIAKPDIAMITSVGVAHMESMGSIEAIAAEKASLLEYVRPGGHAILNADDVHVARMADEFTGTLWRVSTLNNVEAEITASHISFGPDGARFTVSDENGVTCDFRTVLLGRHNVGNILMAIAAGRIHGLRLRQMTAAIEDMEPVPHRLALRMEGEITVIDDAFNSNPVGARNALEILGQFTAGRRVVVTPGMIELGDIQGEENRLFGLAMKDHVDHVILVGERQTAPIREGLDRSGFDPTEIHTVASLFEAQSYLKQYLLPGDTVLYENDLPDQFDES